MGKNIAKYRKQKGFSQDDLALEAEIGRRTINRIEVGETNARFTTLFKIAQTLEIEIGQLVKYISSKKREF